MKDYFYTLAGILSVFLGLLAGCGQSEDSPSSNNFQVSNSSGSVKLFSNATPVDGGRILFGIIGEPSNLIPPLATDSASHQLADHIYVAPLKYNSRIELVPWAAESYQILDNGLRIRFKLRSDIRWFDGAELTADDVLFTYNLMINPETPTAYAEDYKAVKEFNLIGKYEFEVTYEKPFARALITWAHSILPRHILENEDLLQTGYSRNPVGAGAYMLKNWESGRRITLQANPDYFEGRAHIEEIVYRIIPDPATMFMELKAGGIDMMDLSPQQYLYQTGTRFWEDEFQKYKYLSFSYTYLGYNLSHPLFKNVRIRRALTMAIDKQEIVKGVLLGLGAAATGPYKPGTWQYNSEIKDYAFDPDMARAILSEEGWKDTDDDGWLDKDGHKFEFTVLTNQGNDLRVKSATIIQNRLKKIGIKIEIRTVEWATFIKEFVDKGRFDALILGWNILQDPDIYNVWHSSKAGNGGLNFVGYKNDKLDELLEEGRSTLDQAKRKKIYDQIQEILHRDQPYTFLYVPMSLPILQARFQGVKEAAAGITYNFNKWWVPESLRRSGSLTSNNKVGKKQ